MSGRPVFRFGEVEEANRRWVRGRGSIGRGAIIVKQRKDGEGAWRHGLSSGLRDSEEVEGRYFAILQPEVVYTFLLRKMDNTKILFIYFLISFIYLQFLKPVFFYDFTISFLFPEFLFDSNLKLLRPSFCLLSEFLGLKQNMHLWFLIVSYIFQIFINNQNQRMPKKKKKKKTRTQVLKIVLGRL